MSPDQTTELKMKVAELEAALLSANPMIPVLLRTIHTQLRKDPEVVTIMTSEEIGVVVNALKYQTKTEITTTLSTKSASSVTAKIKKAAANNGSSVDLF